MSTTTLERLADILLEALDSQEPGGTLVRVDLVEPEDVQLALKPIDVHPTVALAGFRVPASCYALGIATGGWAAPMGAKGRPSNHPDAQRVFQVVLVDRAGAIVGRMRRPDGSVLTEAPASGDVLDALRAALGVRAA